MPSISAVCPDYTVITTTTGHHYILPTPLDAPRGRELTLMLWLHVDGTSGHVAGRAPLFSSADLELKIVDGALS